MDHEQLDLGAVRSRLENQRGKQYWRSLEEIANTPEFEQFLHREFPRGASEWNTAVSRRSFLKLSAAAMALAGLTACGQPREKILPYNQMPEEIVPGKPIYFASTLTHNGYARGVLVESHMGRPTKVEGNPQHPASLGATDVFAQAELLMLYDPERSQTATYLGRPNTWNEFTTALSSAIPAQGNGLAILTGPITSPTQLSLLRAIRENLPGMTWYVHDPVDRSNVTAGLNQAFGQDLTPIYRMERANVVLSLDSNFLTGEPGSLRYARDFMSRRMVRSNGNGAMNRLYTVETMPTPTGAVADHRLPLRPSQIVAFARALAAQLGVSGVSAGGADIGEAGNRWLQAVAADLQANNGTSLVVAGHNAPPAVHALAAAINDALGNTSETVLYIPSPDADPELQPETLAALASAIDSNSVSMLITIGTNPVYSAPADLNFEERYKKVAFTAHMGLNTDETSAVSQWHIPMSHELEAWGDARAFDGTASIIQPLIAPLYQSHSPYELLDLLAGGVGRSGYDIIREFWASQWGGGSVEKRWREALHDGVIIGSNPQPADVTLAGSFDLPDAPAGDLEVAFKPDPYIWDGHYANNSWLQELPKPITTLTWDNAVYISYNTAQRLGLKDEDLVNVIYNGRSVQGAVLIVPGHADEAITLTLGYKRRAAGEVGNDHGYNAYLVRTADAPWGGAGARLEATGEKYLLARTQDHFAIEGRDLVQEADLAEFNANPTMFQHGGHGPAPAEGGHSEPTGEHGEGTGVDVVKGEGEDLPDLYPDYDYSKGYQWGMVIDLQTCIGCNACNIACTAENNIPTVGKAEVLNSREMHWIKVDTYFSHGAYNPDSPAEVLNNPEFSFQPRPCMHCEKAPCEVVCPVAATTHSTEGLNQMTYNRCVGTRYCSNNCPYKVRRFNFLNWTDTTTPVIQLMRNPDVTVRDRGIIEKCTYCVQRINHARIDADVNGTTIGDGDVLTACQQVCPTNAIVFGDINDPNSQVAQLKALPHNYGMLVEIGAVPRTSYLARLRNPNPDLSQE